MSPVVQDGNFWYFKIFAMLGCMKTPENIYKKSDPFFLGDYYFLFISYRCRASRKVAVVNGWEQNHSTILVLWVLEDDGGVDLEARLFCFTLQHDQRDTFTWTLLRKTCQTFSFYWHTQSCFAPSKGWPIGILHSPWFKNNRFCFVYIDVWGV